MPPRLRVRRLVYLVAAAALLGAAPDEPRAPEAARGMPLQFQANFESGDLAGWDFTDPKAWKIAALEGGKHVLDQFRASQYTPAVRSPFNIALVRELDLADFVLEVQVRSTARDYGHRDLCLFFGYNDPSHFYYAHLGKQADPHANSIFLVNGQPRVSVAEKRTSGTPWTDGWHHVRIVRKVADGLIEVYFDDMAKPAMVAHDQTFRHGRVGLGSFDDTGQFDDLAIWGAKAPRGAAGS